MAKITLPLDESGLLASNRRDLESQYVSYPEGLVLGQYNFFVPDYAPFFTKDASGNDIQIRHVDTDTILTFGVDYTFGWKHYALSFATARDIYGCVMLTDLTLEGTFEILEYQSVGENYVRNEQDILQWLSDRTRNPLSTTWESILGQPEGVPPLQHLYPFPSVMGHDELITAIASLEGTLASLQQYGLSLRNNLYDELMGLSKPEELNTFHRVEQYLNSMSDYNSIAYLAESQRLNHVDVLDNIPGWKGYCPIGIDLPGTPLQAVYGSTDGNHYAFVLTTTHFVRIALKPEQRHIVETYDHTTFSSGGMMTSGEYVYWIGNTASNTVWYRASMAVPATIEVIATVAKYTSTPIYIEGLIGAVYGYDDSGEVMSVNNGALEPAISGETLKFLGGSKDDLLLVGADNTIKLNDGSTTTQQGSLPASALPLSVWRNKEGAIRGVIAEATNQESPTFMFYDLSGAQVDTVTVPTLGATRTMYYIGHVLFWHGSVNTVVPQVGYMGNSVRPYTHAASFDNGRTWYPVPSIERYQMNHILPLHYSSDSPTVLGFLYESGIALSYRGLEVESEL